MFSRAKPIVGALWSWFRNRTFFVQCLLVGPAICAIAFAVLIGNLGLALMGGAVALSGPVVGWIGGILAITFTKAASVIIRDKRSTR